MDYSRVFQFRNVSEDAQNDKLLQCGFASTDEIGVKRYVTKSDKTKQLRERYTQSLGNMSLYLMRGGNVQSR